MSLEEDPYDKDSFGYLMSHVLGRDCDYKLAAKRLGIQRSLLYRILAGNYVPSRSYVGRWPAILHEHYNLDRPFGETGITLRARFESKVATLPIATQRIPNSMNDDILDLAWEISGKRRDYVHALADAAGLERPHVATMLHMPELVAAKRVNNLAAKLLAAFPDKKAKISRLKIILLLSKPAASVAAIKKNIKQADIDFRQAAGMLIRELRIECGDSIEAVEALFKAPVLKGKLGKIEDGDDKLPITVYRSAIGELDGIYRARKPQTAMPYIATLGQIQERLRPR